MRLGIIVLILSTALATICQSVIAQSNNELVLNRIGECIVDHDAEKLSTFFNDRVEITLQGQSKEYAKNQAKYVMKDFLNTYPPAAFSFTHEGQTENTIYALATYRSPEGTFEVDLYLKLDQDGYVIDQIKFEKEN